ncbi:MAG: TonB family protein [Acidobacteriota bacterium]
MADGMLWLRNRKLRLALELSLLVHLLLAWVVPQAGPALAALLPVPAQPTPAPQDARDESIRFELVELPEDREEQPSRPGAPGSDLSRRAHGGEVEQALRPATRGNTPELRLAPFSASPAMPSSPAAPDSSAPREAERSERARLEQPAETGGELVLRPAERPQPARPVLKGLSGLAAQPPGAGAAPDRKGGRVDLESLSFDTQWFDWGPYAAEMLRRIRYHWQIPEIAKLGVEGVARIRFFIRKNGQVEGLEIQSEAQHPPMTFAARDAILDASPLPPLPAELGSEREGVTITFYYNTRPPDDTGDDDGY